MGTTTWIALAVRNGANMGISARLATAAFARVEPDAYAFAIHCLAGPALLKFQGRVGGLRSICFGLRLDFGLRSGLWRRW